MDSKAGGSEYLRTEKRIRILTADTLTNVWEGPVLRFPIWPDWQDRLMKIAYDTAVDSVVNPEGIVEEVSRIAQTLQ